MKSTNTLIGAAGFSDTCARLVAPTSDATVTTPSHGWQAVGSIAKNNHHVTFSLAILSFTVYTWDRKGKPTMKTAITFFAVSSILVACGQDIEVSSTSNKSQQASAERFWCTMDSRDGFYVADVNPDAGTTCAFDGLQGRTMRRDDMTSLLFLGNDCEVLTNLNRYAGMCSNFYGKECKTADENVNIIMYENVLQTSESGDMETHIVVEMYDVRTYESLCVARYSGTYTAVNN